MEEAKYAVVVSESEAQDEQTAIASASAYLAHAEVIGNCSPINADILDVNLYGANATKDYIIGVCISFEIADSQDVELFEAEMERLKDIKSYMRVDHIDE